MSGLELAVPAVNAGHRPMHAARVARSYCLEIYYELLRLLRTPGFAIPALIFPVMFYGTFGVMLELPGADPMRGTYLLATYGVFGAMAPGLFGFGLTLAFERQQRLFVFRRALPMPMASYLVSRMIVAMMMAAVVFGTLFAAAKLGGEVEITALQYAGLAAVDILGVLPFCSLGFYIGALASGEGAQTLLNIVYLPMAVLSGLWVPLASLPPFLSAIAPIWPSYHLSQLALHVIGASGGPIAVHIAVPAAMTIVFFGLARRRLGRMNMR